MKTYEVQLSHDDCAKLKKLHYLDSSLVSLLGRISPDDSVNPNGKEIAKEYFNQYLKNYTEYEDFKAVCTDKYIPAECDRTKTSWNADFEKEVLVFTQND